MYRQHSYKQDKKQNPSYDEVKNDIIEDLGMWYPLPTSKTSRRFIRVRCHSCGEGFNCQLDRLKRRGLCMCSPDCDLYKPSSFDSDELNKCFVYNKDTGLLFKKVKLKNGDKIGEVVGTRNTSGYLSTGIDKKRYLVHRIIYIMIYGQISKGQHIDHVNHKRDDNRLLNLREVLPQENHMNRTLASNNSSGVTGVCKDGGKWVAYATLRGVKKREYFRNKKDAIIKRREWSVELDFHPNHGNKGKHY